MNEKKNKDVYFVSLGLKRNGKIVKNEQYGVLEFVNLIVKKPKLFFLAGFKNLKNNVVFNIFKLIDSDDFGKKKRK